MRYSTIFTVLFPVAAAAVATASSAHGATDSILVTRRTYSAHALRGLETRTDDYPLVLRSFLESIYPRDFNPHLVLRDNDQTLGTSMSDNLQAREHERHEYVRRSTPSLTPTPHGGAAAGAAGHEAGGAASQTGGHAVGAQTGATQGTTGDTYVYRRPTLRDDASSTGSRGQLVSDGRVVHTEQRPADNDYGNPV
ncbi:hypothetical protein EIP91_005412 [Steccherinum ochraceum]|uniref:Uncharacterized protein n=1 Tax=Steccherinum ochraceum TaxID=92696 RepID=A0A4R0R762_9APHY|nr:hypothetical protein EIP91_005412 [Steccherinum ochraceum]